MVDSVQENRQTSPSTKERDGSSDPFSGDSLFSTQPTMDQIFQLAEALAASQAKTSTKSES